MSEGLASLRVLVVDDNAQMRSIIGAMLSGAGVGMLHYAVNGEHGLEVVHAFKPDVIYCDYEMPRMNGLDFIAAVRGLKSEARFSPIILLTGHSDLKRLNAARDLGVNEFVAKPVSARTLLTRLQAVILNPRPFIACAAYFGPDRRRRRVLGYSGPFRREEDRARSLVVDV